jgi:hypothetical protein
MTKVRDRQNYRWLENEINNGKGVRWVKEICLEDLASYLEGNLGINDSRADAKIYRGKKIYEPEAIDVKVIESEVVRWQDEVKDKSRVATNWFEKSQQQGKSRFQKSQGSKSAVKQFLKSQWQGWQGGAIALASRVKKVLLSASKYLPVNN